MSACELSFTAADNSGEYPKLNMWAPKRTDDHSEDTALGRRCFKELADQMIRTNNPTLLLRVLEAQVRGGQWSGVEIGFAHQMAETAMEGALA